MIEVDAGGLYHAANMMEREGCRQSKKKSSLRAARTLALASLLTTAISCNDTNKIPAESSLKDRAELVTGFQERHGDEIIVAGKLYRIGTPVVTWMDAGGYDAYRTDRRFVPYEQSSFSATTRIASTQPKLDLPTSPERLNLRYARTATTHYTPKELEQIRGGGWTLEQLQKEVDQFVIHYDVAGTSKTCFKVLQDFRGLSVQFMLDIDGTIYQTCDLKERAFHATKSNDRSVGIEIANMGSYSSNESIKVLEEWYRKDESGNTRLTIPARYGPDPIRLKDLTLRPVRNEMVVGSIQGRTQRMYDLTPQQYASLVKLTAALCDIFPEMQCDAPRGDDGKVTTVALAPDQWEKYKGVLGHYHVQTNKSDPGPAFNWDYVLDESNKLLAARRARAAGKETAELPLPSAKRTTTNLMPTTMPAQVSK